MSNSTSGAQAHILSSPYWGSTPIVSRHRRGRLPANVVRLATVQRLRVGDICEPCRGAVPVNHGKRVRILRFDADGWAEVESLSGTLTVIDTETRQVVGQSYIAYFHPDNLRRMQRPETYSQEFRYA